MERKGGLRRRSLSENNTKKSFGKVKASDLPKENFLKSLPKKVNFCFAVQILNYCRNFSIFFAAHFFCEKAFFWDRKELPLLPLLSVFPPSFGPRWP